MTSPPMAGAARTRPTAHTAHHDAHHGARPARAGRAAPPTDSLLPPGLLRGERRAVARAISRIEQGAPDAAALRAALVPHLGRAHVIGITGAPGAGKSTLVHALLGELLGRGQRIGVVAVDPSSPLSGGAVLGDRVRMGEHGAHPHVFIRSVASRGHLGGLSPTTRAIVDVLDAAGFDTVIVETVGAGQSEVEIMAVADTRVVVCPPGLGDVVQASKAGILEIADLLVVSKADLPGAEATARDLREMLQLRAQPAADAWKVPVLGVQASTGVGTGELMVAALEHGRHAGRGRRLHADAKSAAAAARVFQLAAADPFLRATGITCVRGGPGEAEVRLTLRPEHLNFNGSCHGGIIFALADTAFGLAANSHGLVAAGIDAHITYQQAAREGETVTAHAREVSRSRKLAVYRVDVARGDGQPISSFTGTVYVTSRHHA
ncbi:MAG: methylmalonyl Co-A mutase-associated GTPase MeaB [Rubrivivax sp.]|nr:methylmalonyl Co-A mutase-associated GTPase MeaB [Rubrivivax sp.]